VNAVEGRGRRWTRRLLKTALVLALLQALFLALLPWLARPLVAGALTAVLRRPVAIGALRWRTADLNLVAEDVRIGGAPAEVAVRRVVIAVDPRGTSWGRVRVRRVDIEAPAGTVALDELLGDNDAAGPATPPLLPVAVRIRELAVSDAALSLLPPQAVGTALALVITRAVARDVELGRGRALQLSGEIEGTLDGAPLSGTAEVHLAPDGRHISGTVTVTQLPLRGEMLPLPAGIASVGGTVDATATMTADGEGEDLRAEVRIAKAAVDTSRGATLRAAQVAMPAVRVDLDRRRVDLGAVEVRDPVVTVDLAAEHRRDAAASTASRWSVRCGVVSARGGALRLRRGDAAAALQLTRARWEGLADVAAKLELAGTTSGGGRVSIDGTVRAEPLRADLTVQADGVAAAPWARLIELPLRLARGTVGGTAQLAYRDGIRSLSGELRASDVHTLPPDPERPLEVLAVASATAAFTYEPGEPATIAVSSAALSYPYAMVVHGDAGTFPYTVIARPSAGSAGEHAPPLLRVAQVTVEHGTLEFIDDTLTPPFWTSLSDVTASATRIAVPPGTIEAFTLAGKRDELSPVLASGSVTPEGLGGRLQVTDVLLDSLNPYIAPRLGYRITAGRLSTVATATPDPPLLVSAAEVVLNGVDVLQTGTDIVLEQSGVPLPVALSLIADAGGQIDLKVPFSIDTTSGDVAIGSVVWQAVRKAIVSALTSPLRILGSLFGLRGAPHAFAVAPVPFAAGSAVLDAAGRQRVNEIARIVQAHQGLLLVLLPQVTGGDIAALGAAGAAALARDRNAAARAAFIAAGVPGTRLILAPWDPDKDAKATGRPGVYVELQDAG
jgi:hypothetical protein